MSKSLAFQKWEATGNDFFFIDSIAESVAAEDLGVDEVRAICDRSGSGGGADGVVLYRLFKDASAQMTIFNSDGSRGDMCGNALRCLSRILSDQSGRTAHSVQLAHRAVTVVAGEGGTGSVLMGLPAPQGEHPVFQNLPELDSVMGGQGYLLSFGNPHYVVPSEYIPDDWEERGERCQPIADKLLRTGGINCGFLQIGPEGDQTSLRVYERGAGATRSCGSGACAASAVLEHLSLKAPPHRLFLTGGELKILRDGADFVLSGPVIKVYEGVWER